MELGRADVEVARLLSWGLPRGRGGLARLPLPRGLGGLARMPLPRGLEKLALVAAGCWLGCSGVSSPERFLER